MRTDRPTRETMSLDEATVSNKIRKVTLLQEIYFQCNFRLFTAKEADSTKPFGSAAHKQSSQCRTTRRSPFFQSFGFLHFGHPVMALCL